MISGKPVKSSIARTARPASWSSRAVPPVETSSTPSSARPRAKSTTPVLSDTESRARRTWTAPGCVGVGALVDEVAGGSAMAPSIVARPAEPPTRRMGALPCGQLASMEHPRSDAEEQLEKTGDELEERLERLDEHLDEAHHELDERRQDAAEPAEDVAGDWEGESSGAQRGG